MVIDSLLFVIKVPEESPKMRGSRIFVGGSSRYCHSVSLSITCFDRCCNYRPWILLEMIVISSLTLIYIVNPDIVNRYV